MYKQRLLALAAASSIFLAACGGADNKTANETTSNAEKTESSSTSDKPEKATIGVTITGGDLAGSYTAVCKDGCCSWGIAGENVFGNQYSETGKGPKELSSVQLIVDDVKEGSKTTKEFMMTVSFGELFSKEGKSFNINTRKGANEGSGTLDVQYSGNKATVTVKGVSKEGPSIDLKLECNNVMSPTNLGQ
jgi:hypothetical protein